MNVQKFWDVVLAQIAEEIPQYFTRDAKINWHCTNERFTVAEFVRANCEYPGEWDGEVERICKIPEGVVTVVRVFPKDQSASFHVTSFMTLQDDKIKQLDEYWGDDGEAPQWRRKLNIGKQIK